MKEMLKKFFVFTACAALMSVMLTSCGDDPDMPDINDDPAAYLQTAISNTMAEISDRYSASPISAILNSISGPVNSVGFDMGISANAETVSLGGTLYSDTENNQYLFDGSIGASGVELGAQFYYQPEFIGVACEFLLGSNIFYGFRPYGLVEQATGSIFDASTGSELGMDITQLQELDDMLDAFKSADGLSIQEMIDASESAYNDFLSGLSFTVEEQSISLAGEEHDGYSLTAQYTGENMAQLTEDMMNILKDSSLFTAMFDLSAQTGSGTTEADFNAQIDAMIQELADDDTQITVIYYVCQDKVVSMDTTASDFTDEYITIDYYGDDGSTITMGYKDKVYPIFSSTVDTSTGYSHTATLNGEVTINDGYAPGNMSMVTNWNSETGSLESSIQMENGMDSISMSFSGTLTASQGEGFALENGQLNMSTPTTGDITCNLSISGGAEESFPTPAETVNIFELSEDELYNIISNVYYMLYM